MDDSQRRSVGIDPRIVIDLKKIQVDPGPYEATVLSHVEESRSGEVYVYIPEICGPDPAAAAIKVGYASPFFGKTFGTDSQNYPNNSYQAGQSYGMWMVPPDIGTIVLVTFVSGNRGRGYWFACPYNTISHHMVPTASRNIGNQTLDPQTESLLAVSSADSNFPVTEYTTNLQANPTAFTDYVNSPRPVHEYQSAILVAQGLDRDKIRGAISSSSMREVPSNVFGINTPGRKGTKTDQFAGNPDAVIYRTGGHSFVMDDGAEDGTDQLIRLKTAGGHQILLNDTEKIIYIASRTGNQWMEFSADGSINIYGAAGFNLRSKGAINLHSDSIINMNAQAIQMNASKVMTLTSGGSLSASSAAVTKISANGALSLSGMATASLSSAGMTSITGALSCSINAATVKLNCGTPLPPIPALPATTNSLQDTTFSNGQWVAVEGYIDTICTVVPAHEPWVQADRKSRPAPVKTG
jgi:hypothetical protein